MVLIVSSRRFGEALALVSHALTQHSTDPDLRFARASVVRFDRIREAAGGWKRRCFSIAFNLRQTDMFDHRSAFALPAIPEESHADNRFSGMRRMERFPIIGAHLAKHIHSATASPEPGITAKSEPASAGSR